MEHRPEIAQSITPAAASLASVIGEGSPWIFTVDEK